MKNDIQLWEVLVPASNGRKINFTYEHHKQWDAFVTALTNGITILKTGKGEWTSPSGEVFKDRIIPCRIACNEETIHKIIDFTLVHYNQEAVFCYKVSNEVIIKYKND